MWSCGFSTSLDIEPARSLRLQVLIIASAGMALTSIAISELSPNWLTGLTALVVVETLRLLRRHGPRGVHTISRLRLGPDGQCWAALGGAELGPVRLRCRWACPVFAVGLELRPAGAGTRRVLLFRDQVDPPTWRRLLVRCRQSNPEGMT